MDSDPRYAKKALIPASSGEGGDRRVPDPPVAECLQALETIGRGSSGARPGFLTPDLVVARITALAAAASLTAVTAGLTALGAGCSSSKREEQPLTAAERSGLRGAIYFVSEASGTPKAFRIRPDGSNLAALSPGDDVADFPYGASPDGQWVALVRGDEGAHDVLLVRPNGKDAKVIASGDGVDWYPMFSPDGAWVLFESARASFRDLYKIPATGGEPVRLTDNQEGNFDGAWSPDGKRIAFASSRHGQLDLFVMNADGSDQKRLTDHPGDSIKPAWSPDGKLIAFISGRDGNDDLFVMNADGTNIRNLSGDALQVEERFAWNPSGTEIAYVAVAKDTKRKVHVVSVATGKDRVLSSERHDDFNPAWSPDGAFIAFASQEVRGHPDLWIMRADGRQRTRLTHDPRGAWLPRWLDVRE